VTKTREKRMIKVRDMVPSPERNVRGGERTGIEELAELIYAQDLLHPPTVVPAKVGKGKKARTVYETDAGERRRLAMFLLIDQGRWPEDKEIEANIAEPEEGVELSLGENVGSQPMHPVDAYIAFRKLIETEGKSPADVAEHFGVKEVTVLRRMKLANVAPELLDLYRQGDIDTEQVMALAVTDDHEAQRRVWEHASPWERDATNLRAALTHAEFSTLLDPVAAWVGAEAFEAAGGSVRRDLFSDEGEAFIADRELLDRIAADMLQPFAEQVKAEGWGWVEVRARVAPNALLGFNRCPNERREPTDHEATQITALEQRLEQLDGELQALYDDESEELDEDKVGALEAENERCVADLEALQASLLRWNEDMIAHAGAVVTLGKERGKEPVIVVHRGLVVPEDREALNEAAVAAGVEPIPATARLGGHPAVQQAKASAPKPEYAESLMRKLTAHRTAALQAVIAGSPQVATALLVERLVSEWCDEYLYNRSSCLKVTATDAEHALTLAADDLAGSKAWTELQARKEQWTQRLAATKADGTLLQALLALPLLDLHELLALSVALMIDAVQARAAQGPADTIAQVIGLDMADWWAPTAGGFLAQVPKAKLVEAVTEAVSEDAAKPLGALKKVQAVVEAERLLAGTRWLPAPLRAPRFDLQAQGDDEVDPPEGVGEAGLTADEPAAADEALAAA